MMLNIDLDLERAALSYLLSPYMTIEILLRSKIDSRIFSDRDHSLIAKVLIPNFGKKKELIKSLLQKVSTGLEHFKTLRRLYDVSQKEIGKFNQKDFYDVVDRLKELLVLREVERLLESTVREDMPLGDAKKCLENLSKGLFKIRNGTKFEDVERKDISEIASEQTDKLDKKVESIPSGIASIDKIVGGWRFGDLIIIGSKSSGGKSCFLMNFGYKAYRSGFNVCYITIEMTLEQFHERYISMISQIPFDHVRNRTLNPIEKRSIKKYHLLDMFEESQREKVEKFLIHYHKNKKRIDNIKIDDLKDLMIERGFEKRKNLYLPLEIMSNCTVERVEYEVKSFMLNNKLHVLIVDYPGIMEYEKGRAGESNWFALSDLFKRLKSLAGEHKIVVLTAAQATEQEMRYSKGIKDHADLVFSWDQKDDDKLLNKIRMKILKGRNVPITTMEVREDFSTMKISDLDGEVR